MMMYSHLSVTGGRANPTRRAVVFFHSLKWVCLWDLLTYPQERDYVDNLSNNLQEMLKKRKSKIATTNVLLI